jgi:plastocyanin
MNGLLNRGLRYSFVSAVVLVGVALLALACGGDGQDAPSTGETPTGGETTGGTAQINMIPSISFDKEELTIPANQDVTITADNQDGSTPHNFSVYSERDAPVPIATTEICNAPCTRALTLNLEPGEYFFRCDVHPLQMTGKLIVGGSASMRY